MSDKPDLKFSPLSNWIDNIESLSNFVNACVQQQDSRGALIGLSGGIDSAVVAALAVRALGPEKVHACILPDRDSDESTVIDAQRVVDWLGIKHVRLQDISPILEALGTYRLFPELYALPKEQRRQAIRQRKEALLRSSHFDESNSDFLEDYRRRSNPEMNRIRSLWNSKIRTRMVVLYREAELENLLVLGTTNRSEYMTGWFTKYGDGAVDLEVILPLYKTRVFEVAEQLGVPQSIRLKPPTADILPDITDEDMLGLRYALLDRVLLGFDLNLSAAEIAGLVNIDVESVDRIASLVHSSRFSRSPPLAPQLTIR